VHTHSAPIREDFAEHYGPQAAASLRVVRDVRKWTLEKGGAFWLPDPRCTVGRSRCLGIALCIVLGTHL